MNKKVLVLAWVVAAIVAALFWMSQSPLLFKNGQSEYAIVLCDDASVSEKTAAEELQAYLRQISGAELPLVNSKDLEDGRKHIYVGFNKEYAAECGVEAPDDIDEGYTYRTVGDNIWIYGGKNRGTMYGVYAFLENEFGVRWYTVDYTKIPVTKKWKVKDFCRSEQPLVRFRFDQYYNVLDEAWLARNKCNSDYWISENKYGGLSSYWEGHTFRIFISPEEYFSEHPEYFSMREGGVRRPDAQLCLSNPEVLQICIDKMKYTIATNPLFDIYSMSQNDNPFPCLCDKCRAIEEQYGGHSGLLLWFVNQVADAIKPIYPDKYIGTFAYMYTRKPPVGIVPRNNVVIRLCSLECCRAHPIEECEHNRSFMSDIENWSKIAPNIYIWDYVVNFSQYVAPFPNFNVLAENIRTFMKYNVMGIRQQANYQSVGGEFSEMKAWVISKLLWNPYQDTRKLVSQFINDYYGEAASCIQQYFDLCHSLIKDETVFDIYIDANAPLYTDEFVREAREILNKARQAVASSAEDMRLRVDMVVLQIDYLRMCRTPKETLADGTYDRVWAFVRKHNIRIHEWQEIEENIQLYNEKYLK
ncbi:MAG: DUF4838 domain-containing protein [Bacteroidaceae bacterium]|nr:DUF4838 domain-containing protein [Bacteroidaceae bacterium]